MASGKVERPLVGGSVERLLMAGTTGSHPREAADLGRPDTRIQGQLRALHRTHAGSHNQSCERPRDHHADDRLQGVKRTFANTPRGYDALSERSFARSCSSWRGQAGRPVERVLIGPRLCGSCQRSQPWPHASTKRSPSASSRSCWPSWKAAAWRGPPSDWASAPSACIARCIRWRRHALRAVPPGGRQPAAERRGPRAGGGRPRCAAHDGRKASARPAKLAGYAADRIRIGSLYSLTRRHGAGADHGAEAAQARNPDRTRAGVQRRSAAQAARRCHRRRPHGAARGRARTSSHSCSSKTTSSSPRRTDRATTGRRRSTSAPVSNERFVSLSEGFVTYSGFLEAFRDRQVHAQCRDEDRRHFLADEPGGGRHRLHPAAGAHGPRCRSNVQLIPLQARYLMRQKIIVVFLRTRERDPNLLALLAVCRGLPGRHAPDGPDQGAGPGMPSGADMRVYPQSLRNCAVVAGLD